MVQRRRKPLDDSPGRTAGSTRRKYESEGLVLAAIMIDMRLANAHECCIEPEPL
jgi:hypothetical protein